MINNLDDLIDSRDVIDAIGELENEENLSEGDEVLLGELKELASECEGYGDWEYGATLIRASYWVDYAQEMLVDCGDIPQELPWYIAIDWEQTADNLLADYTEVDFGGIPYYIRCV
jgi:hypothetical protein